MKNWIRPWLWGNTECCCEDYEDRDDGNDGEDGGGEDDPTHHGLPVGLGGDGGLLGVPDRLHLGHVGAVLGGVRGQGNIYQSQFYILINN